jgi:uncharacterized membrane protein
MVVVVVVVVVVMVVALLLTPAGAAQLLYCQWVVEEAVVAMGVGSDMSSLVSPAAV